MSLAARVGGYWKHPANVAGPLAPAASPPPGRPFLTGVFGVDARIIVQAAFGADLAAPPQLWNWYDITADVRQADGQRVAISPVGRSDEFSTAQPAGCTFQLDNARGDYTAYHPTGRWWPYVRRNTPIRICVNLSGQAADTVIRFDGQATGWVPSWDTSAQLAVVTVSASGQLRRLQQGKTPLLSPIRRALTLSDPAAYWTLDDGKDATAPASGLPGGAGSPMVVRQAAQAAAVDGPAGAPAPLPEFVNGDEFAGGFEAYITHDDSNGWAVEAWVKITPVDPLVACEALLLRWRTTGNVGDREWRVAVGLNPTTDGQIFVTALSDGVFFSVASGTGLPAGQWWHLRVETEQSTATTVTSRLWLNGDLFATDTFGPTATAGRVAYVAAGPYGFYALAGAAATNNVKSLSLGHLAVYAQSTIDDHYPPGIGYAGETAGQRLARLCTENGLTFTYAGDLDTTTAMGAQSTDTLVALLREAETADGGVLHDGLSPGLHYVTRTSRYNTTAVLSADMAADPPQVAVPFSPTDDDQRNRNVFKADRRGGSNVIFSDTTGPLGTATIGTYDSSGTFNLDSDAHLIDQAAWQVHLGTVEGFRHPNLSLDLAATPELAAQWLRTRVGNRVDITNVTSAATQHPPGDVDLFVEGWSEQMGPFDWQVTANCAPYQPWEVFVLEAAANRGRIDLTQTVTATVDTDDTAWSLSTPTGDPLLIVSADFPAEFPFDVDVDGEQVTVTAISGATSPQAATVTRNVNGAAKTHAAGTAVRLWKPPAIAL